MTELMGKRLPWQNALPKRIDWASQRPRQKPEGQQHGATDDLHKLKPGEGDHDNLAKSP